MKSAPSLSVSSEQRGSLEKMARSTSLPHRGVVQAKALLWAADGVANEEIARRLRGRLRRSAAVAEAVQRAGCGRGGGDRQGPGPSIVVAGRDGG